MFLQIQHKNKQLFNGSLAGHCKRDFSLKPGETQSLKAAKWHVFQGEKQAFGSRWVPRLPEKAQMQRNLSQTTLRNL